MSLLILFAGAGLSVPIIADDKNALLVQFRDKRHLSKFRDKKTVVKFRDKRKIVE